MKAKSIKKKRKSRQIEIITIVIHLMICAFLWICYSNNLFEPEKIKHWTSSYFLMLPLFLIGIQFRNLRNIKYFIFWTIIGFGQLFVFLIEKDNLDFKYFNGTGLDGLKALLPVLILFQILRQISLKAYKREMIISIRQYRMTLYEEEEKRNMTWIEVFFSIILFLSAIVFNVI